MARKAKQLRIDDAAPAKAGPQPIAVSIDVAAKMLSVSRTTLYHFLDKEGGVPTFLVGKRRLVRVSALEQFAVAMEAANNQRNIGEEIEQGLGEIRAWNDGERRLRTTRTKS